MPAQPQGEEEHLNPESRPSPGIPWIRIFLIVGAVIALILPAIRQPRAGRLSVTCKHHLKTLTLALHAYHGEWGELPPAYTVDADGRRLHSWRTLLLPYMDYKYLYDTIDLAKPWNDPVNAEARQTVIRTFHCPADWHDRPETNYLALAGNGFAFHPERSRSFNDFKDGLSQTVLIMEVPRTQSREWMEPVDADEAMFLSFQPDSKLNHKGGINCAMADGSVRFLGADLPAENRKALLTISAGDDPGEF